MGSRSPVGLQRGWVITVTPIERFAIVFCGGSEPWWVGLKPTTRNVYLSRAEAALRFLGCVNSKGEVVALGRGAVGKARQALGDAEELFSSDLWSHAQLRVLVHSLLDALRALRGEGGEA